MNVEQNTTPLKNFNFEGNEQLVSYVKTMHVADGVDCEAYTFDGDLSKDLGIIKIRPGYKTPLQRVLKGDKTIEGYISGKGKLTLTKPDGTQEIHVVREESQGPFSITVRIGELMQWEATKNSDLVVYEACFPPYEDGRYENIK